MKTQGPISIVPFTIYNRPAFIEQDHPIINPRDEDYEKYWMGITEKCLYGLWGLDQDGDKGGWRWMPGNLYFYVNITKIEIQGEDNTAEQEHPTLRDTTWLKSYGFNACEGFSGFSDDEEYTCFRPIQKIEQGIKLKHIERKQLEKEAQYILKPDGSYKKYMEAREYLYQTFDRPMGKPLWRNEAKNFLELTTRGVGKSYELANSQICYDYVFNGCKNMEDVLSQKKATVIVVGSSVSKWSDDLLNKFSVTYEYLRTNCGYYFDGFEETFGWFWQPYEGQLSISGKPFTNRTQLAGGQGFIGAGSKIYNVSYYKKDNAGIGKRARKFITDEAGTLENFKKVHGLNSAAQIRESKYGFSAYSGCVCAGTKVWTKEGKIINIEDLKKEDGLLGYDGENVTQQEINWFKEPSKKLCYRIKTKSGNNIECSFDHPLLIGSIRHITARKSIENGKATKRAFYQEAKYIKKGDQLFVPGEINIFGDKEIKEARLLGLLIGDGNYSDGYAPSLSVSEKEILDYVTPWIGSTQKLYNINENRTYRQVSILGINDLIRRNGMSGQSKLTKMLPNDIHTYNKTSVANLLAGYFDADGNVYYNKKKDVTRVVLTSISKDLLKEVRYQLTKFGIYSVITKEKRNQIPQEEYKGQTPFIFRLYINQQQDLRIFAENIQLLVKDKRDKLKITRPGCHKKFNAAFEINKLNNKEGYFNSNILKNIRLETVKSVECIGEQLVYNLNCSPNHNYISNGYITRQTGGDLTEIEGIKDAFKNPKAYDILGYKDLFSFNNLETGLFIPVYYRKDAYRDKNGNINLQEAYEDEAEIRAEKAKESTEAYNEWIISYPFWPHEMFMQAKDNLFPTVILEERLDELQGGLWDEIAKIINIEYTDTNEKTSVVWNLDLSGRQIPLNDYLSEKDAKNKKGAIVMYEPPMVDRPEPKYTDPLYITVYDPVLKDGDGSSICAVIVFKFFYPKDLSKIQFNIVAEWYGRHETLDENHDVAFKMAIMYGSKLLPEINNADVLRNGKDTMRWNWFQPKPKGALGEFNQTKQYDVGVLITPGMKPALAMYLNEIFNTVIDKDIYEEGGMQYEKVIKMASQLNSIRVIQEALQYGEGNFDAISAMFLVSLVHRNAVLIPHTKQSDKETEESLKSYKRFVKSITYKNQQHPAYAK